MPCEIFHVVVVSWSAINVAFVLHRFAEIPAIIEPTVASLEAAVTNGLISYEDRMYAAGTAYALGHLASLYVSIRWVQFDYNNVSVRSNGMEG